jgi:hypothetical protein
MGKDLKGSDRGLIEVYPGVSVEGRGNARNTAVTILNAPAEIRT